MKNWITALLAALALAAGPALAQGSFPNKPVRFVVSNPPGGQTDVATRIIVAEMQEILKQPMIVENKPGANSNLGAAYVKNAPPDGYTVIVTAINNFGANPALIKDMPFDPVKDFKMVVQTIASTNVIVVRPDSRYKTVADIIADAKARPGKLTYGSAGAGSSMFLFMEMMKSMAGVDIMQVPYQGSAKANIDLMGGQIDMVFDSMPGASSLIQAGKLRPIAVSSAERLPVAPDVPTVGETIKGFAAESWLGFAVPAGTPDDVIDILNKATNQALQSPKVRERLISMGTRPVGGTSAEFSKFVADQVAHWKKVMTASGIQPK